MMSPSTNNSTTIVRLLWHLQERIQKAPLRCPILSTKKVPTQIYEHLLGFIEDEGQDGGTRDVEQQTCSVLQNAIVYLLRDRGEMVKATSFQLLCNFWFR